MDIKKLNAQIESMINESSDSEDNLVDRVEQFLLNHLDAAEKSVKRLESYKNPTQSLLNSLDRANYIYIVIENIVKEFRKEFK